jgi:hypothetical protein
MKCDVMPSRVQMEKVELHQLCTEVKETIAELEIFPVKRKTAFGLADLWNARKSATTAGTRWSKRPVIHARL